MRKITGNEPAMWGPSRVGFDSYHDTYESGREGDMPIVDFSPRKTASVLYGAIGFAGADALLAELGKHTTCKGCLHIKKLADVDIGVLATLVERPLQLRGREKKNKRDVVFAHPGWIIDYRKVPRISIHKVGFSNGIQNSF